ncbi:MAG: hypothetical protein IT292_00750 [Deltaproteobacteria bacterium]|nr:hypothetical protein [Deltaproteobacteria bacterium]
MITVMVNGSQLPLQLDGVRTMGELVEVIKMNIDPDSVISAMTIGGRDLVEADWRAPLSVHGTALLEIDTATRGEFLKERLIQAPTLIGKVIQSFINSRDSFRSGEQNGGYQQMGQAVKDFNAFIKWYDVILEYNPALKQSYHTQVVPLINELTRICEQLIQQQLYNSWWAIGETLEKQLEPTLKRLQEQLENIARAA